MNRRDLFRMLGAVAVMPPAALAKVFNEKKEFTLHRYAMKKGINFYRYVPSNSQLPPLEIIHPFDMHSQLDDVLFIEVSKGEPGEPSRTDPMGLAETNTIYYKDGRVRRLSYSIYVEPKTPEGKKLYAEFPCTPPSDTEIMWRREAMREWAKYWRPADFVYSNPDRRG